MDKKVLPIAKDESASIPKHEQLKIYLLRELTEGRLKPGQALPTEFDLATAADVSRNTVRHALAELERSGLIRRVQGCGTFVHESAMQRLKSGLDIFALVIPETRGGYYPSLQRGFHGASADRHNQVIICDTDNDPFRQADALLQLMDKKIAGVAIVPTTSLLTPPHQIRPLQERGIPVVFCHRSVADIQAPLVCFSAPDVGRAAAQAMLERGHRRAAFFASERAGLSSQYEHGFSQTLTAGGGGLPPEFVCYDDSPKAAAEHEQFLKTSLHRLLNSPAPPTAVFCAFDSEAELIYLLLNQMGVKVPDDISLIGFGGTWREGVLARRLTSVTVDEEELGRQAVKLLDEMRRRERLLDDAAEIVMPLSLATGATLGVSRPRETLAPCSL